MSALSKLRRVASPARRQSSFFSALIAICAELLGRLMPSASIAEAMVLAVYMPPQEPGPGMELASIVVQLGGRQLARRVLDRPPRTPRRSSHSFFDSGWMPGQDCAAVNEYARAIQPRESP